jgi:hypothetical protein
MRAIFQISIFFIFLTLSTSLAYSCSCDVASQRQEFRSSDAVFVGEVLEFKERTGTETKEDLILFPYQVTFKIKKQWKGKRQSQIIALTDLGIGPCGGFELPVGERFLIYARRKSGQLTFWRACTRSRKADNVKDEIKNLSNFFFRTYTFFYPYPKF